MFSIRGITLPLLLHPHFFPLPLLNLLKHTASSSAAAPLSRGRFRGSFIFVWALSDVFIEYSCVI